MIWKLLGSLVVLLVGNFLFSIRTKFFSGWNFHNNNILEIKSGWIQKYVPGLFLFDHHNNMLHAQESQFGDFFANNDNNNIPCIVSGNAIKIRKEISDILLLNQYVTTDSQQLEIESKMSNDFAYVTVIPIDHETNLVVNETASAWCQSIRTIHSSHSHMRANFDIVALFSSPSKTNQAERYKCFDRLLFVHEKVNDYLGSIHTSLDSSVVSKLWIFSLVQYKRIIFMKHNVAPLRINIYNYFFKDYYLAGGSMDKSIYTPKKLYSQSSMLSPINTNFMSLEPNIDTAVDLLSIYALQVGKWDVSRGWMCYGSFDFDPVSHMESFEDPNEPFKQYQLNRKKEVHPWRESAWSFDASWSDTGLLFYYHYLLHPKTSGVLYELDFDHTVIEYVSSYS